jgi:hypothetical protein
MKIKKILAGNREITEIISKDLILKNTQDALDLIGNIESEYIILYEYNFENDFFDLSTKKLGDILQKFTNYRVKLAIIGDFEKYKSKTLKDFIYESNKHREYLFVALISQVIKRWSY